ncbi:MAG: hypothetical protein AAGA43_15675 [Bacteroidota bacterium]
MVDVHLIGTRKEKAINSGEVLYEDKKKFKIHSDDRYFSKEEYEYVRII